MKRVPKFEIKRNSTTMCFGGGTRLTNLHDCDKHVHCHLSYAYCKDYKFLVVFAGKLKL